MQRRNKSLKITINNSGASLIFVLVVMLVLMIICSSTLFAANSSAGFGLSRQISNQLNVYSESVQKSIMYSLQKNVADKEKNINSADPLDKLDTLGGQILKVIYEQALDEALGDPPGSFTEHDFSNEVLLNITPSFSDGTELPPETDIKITVAPPIDVFGASGSPLCTVTSYIPEQEEETETLEDGTEIIKVPKRDREPQTAVINATVTVEVTVELKGKSVISAVTYNFLDGYLEDDGSDSTNMIIKNTGEWRFVSHEISDK